MSSMASGRSSTTCFVTTTMCSMPWKRALRRFERTANPFAGSSDPNAAGNGSLMRLAPIPMAFAHDPELAISRAADMSRTTHGASEAVDASRYCCALIVGALTGVSKDALLTPMFAPVPDLWTREPLSPAIKEIVRGSFLRREPPHDIVGSGYVVRSMEAALWALSRGTCFEACVLKAVNLGHDADTTGAICGMLAGAVYGAEGIPAAWRQRVVKGDVIQELAVTLGSRFLRRCVYEEVAPWVRPYH